MTDTSTEAPEEAATDEARSALLEAIQNEWGDALVDSHLVPGTDLWIRVSSQTFGDTADYLRERQRFRFFDYVSAIDWMPSPFGRSLDAEVDKALGAADDDDNDIDATAAGDGDVEAPAIVRGVTGGDTRFQVIARVYNLTTKIGLHVKADVPDDSMTLGSWTGVYRGAEWHEREVNEMFGIGFEGHPGLRPLYLPGDFEGHPMRKDFPLLARLVKPWPGIVDVEPMPQVDNPEDAA